MPLAPWLLAPVAASTSIAVGAAFWRYVRRQDPGSARMREISSAIRVGARAFVRREYRAMAVFVAAAAVLLFLLSPAPFWSERWSLLMNGELAAAYLLGSIGSAVAGVLGLEIATQANTRAASATRLGLRAAFPIGYRAGGVMGLAVVGVALLGVSVVYGVTGHAEAVVGFGFGASSIALFAKAGGGIFTKTADIAADLVGKVELGIPEDDPRNPAVIADNVGDNVGDVAGMGADLFDSYVASLVAVLVLGTVLDGTKVGDRASSFVETALVFAALGVLASIGGTMLVRIRASSDPGRALNMGTYVTAVLFLAVSAGATAWLGSSFRLWGATAAGLLAGVIIGASTDHFTAAHSRAVKQTAEASTTGAAVNIITGFAFGLRSVLPPLLGIAGAATAAYFLCAPLGGPAYAVFGIALAALGMLAIVGVTIANDAYGPVVDNARGIVEQAGLGQDALAVADDMDAAGNAAKAITKGFAIGAAGLTVISLLAAFKTVAERALGPARPPGASTAAMTFSLLDPLVLAGALVGVGVPALFSAMLMLGVGRNVRRMVEDIRRQFAEIPGLREGRADARPDYDRCIDIATRGALGELMPATLMVIGVTVVVGFLGGITCLGGYLAGAILSSLLLGLLMANAGGLWDNAKKLIESGAHGGRGSDAHKAAVVGDTVGDPFKDTAGPSLNTMITVMSLVGTLLAATISDVNLAGWLGR